MGKGREDGTHKWVKSVRWDTDIGKGGEDRTHKCGEERKMGHTSAKKKGEDDTQVWRIWEERTHKC